LESRLFLNTATWTGGAGDNWSNPADWVGNQVPTPGENIVFPNVGGPTTIELSSPVEVGDLTFEGSDWLLGSVTLDGNISVDSSGNGIYGPILGHNVTITAGYGDGFTMQNPSDSGAGFGLTLQSPTLGSGGTVYITGSSGTYTGQTTVQGAALSVQCPLSSSVLLGPTGYLEGSGSVAGINVGEDSSLQLVPLQGATSNLTSTDGIKFTPLNDVYHGISAGFASGSSSAGSFGTLDVAGGSIDLTSARLGVGDAPANLPAGTVLTLISNQTGRAVTGTFVGLPEGALVNDGEYQISYAGGASGRDVTLTVCRPVVWSGAAGDNQWSNPANWQGDAVPTAGQDVDLPSNNMNGNGINIDLDGNVTVRNLAMDGPYGLSGGSITVDGAIVVDGSDGNAPTIDHLVLGHNVLIDSEYQCALQLPKISDDGQGYGVVISSDSSYGHWGYVDLGASDCSYTGTTEVTDGGRLVLIGAVSSRIQVDPGGFLAGSGATAGIESQSGASVGIGEDYEGSDVGSSPYNRFTVDGNLQLDSGSSISAGFAADSTSPPTTSDFAGVTVNGGTITLTGANLFAGMPPSPVPPGTVFTVISNLEANPIVGTFAGLPEGATLDNGAYAISYLGGPRGHDVTLTVLPYITVTTRGHASPNIIAGNSTNLSVAAQVAGNPLAYRWATVTAPPGARRPRFSANGTSASDRVTVTFKKAGYYRFRCTITDSTGHSVASDVSVEVKQTATKLRLSPIHTTVAIGKTVTLHATEIDQFGHPLADQGEPTFSVVAPSTGSGHASQDTINPATGVFTAGTFGSALIQVEDGDLWASLRVQVVP
jgi:hypothetical protein